MGEGLGKKGVRPMQHVSFVLKKCRQEGKRQEKTYPDETKVTCVKAE